MGSRRLDDVERSTSPSRPVSARLSPVLGAFIAGTGLALLGRILGIGSDLVYVGIGIGVLVFAWLFLAPF